MVTQKCLGMQDKRLARRGLTPWLALLIYKILSNQYIKRLCNNASHVIFFSKFCIKSTDSTTLAEAQAMQFVSEVTTIPVPRVYCAFEHNGRVYILMERIQGQSLWNGWGQRPPESRTRILDQLRSMLAELRSLQQPKNSMDVSNIVGGPIYDQRLPTKSIWGTFRTIGEFHQALRNGIKPEDISHDGAPEDLRSLISFHEKEWGRPVFTHGDLSSMNILARGDDVVGILDWETAAWMPSYWEYTCAWNVNPQNQFWQKEVDRFLTPLLFEAEMETIRGKYFGDF
ncbi:hypothetical protein PV08_01738 [Exophiala spinifera]|uniref:Aminoglycoside phosphotransferase domain-containing protein n=1 Tax=Exophiala spinifera TaxID=91928 RepID=A0A0D2BQC6_9EURO|nr:uncharacterized protein PV08_01738 [Exophiala spinifera]KIW21158.1 hypothetical protein PV08_01738 [Exophiala spinifera]